MFVDKVFIKVTAGKGGDGASSFRREKYVPKGGPDGGDGGRGGHIIFEASTHLSTLLDLKYNKRYRAEDGSRGMSKRMHGKDAKDTIIKVPIGTVIQDQQTERVLADLTYDKQQVVLAKGGRGGRGNYHFKSSRNTAPDMSERGEPGQYFDLQVELKLLADAGLVGFPSVGKSTLLSVVSAARPEIADYHFTTIVPNLGVVQVNDGRSFVLADLPGLIEGASQGRGLGHQFLRHIERCRVIVHVIDMAGNEGRNPIEDYQIIVEELKEYKYRLLERPHLIVANKMDLPEAEENLKAFHAKYPDLEVFPISAITHDGLDMLLYRVADLLGETPEFILDKAADEVVVYNYQEEEMFEVNRLDTGEWVISGEQIEKIVEMTNFGSDDGIQMLARRLRELGVDDALRVAGAVDGDTVVIADYHFEFFD